MDAHIVSHFERRKGKTPRVRNIPLSGTAPPSGFCISNPHLVKLSTDHSGIILATLFQIRLGELSNPFFRDELVPFFWSPKGNFLSLYPNMSSLSLMIPKNVGFSQNWHLHPIGERLTLHGPLSLRNNPVVGLMYKFSGRTLRNTRWHSQ